LLPDGYALIGFLPGSPRAAVRPDSAPLGKSNDDA